MNRKECMDGLTVLINAETFSKTRVEMALQAKPGDKELLQHYVTVTANIAVLTAARTYCRRTR